jgi:hypothetical protein
MSVLSWSKTLAATPRGPALNRVPPHERARPAKENSVQTRKDLFEATPRRSAAFALADHLRQEPGAFILRQLHQLGGKRVEVDSVSVFRFAGASGGASGGRRRRK